MKYSQLKNELDRKTRRDDGFDSRPYKKSNLKRQNRLAARTVTARIAIWAVGLMGLFIFFVAFNLKSHVNQKIANWMERSYGRQFEVNFFDYGNFQIAQQGLVFTQVRLRGTIRYDYPYFQPRQFEMDVPILQIYFQLRFGNGLYLGVNIHGLEVRGGALLAGVKESGRRLESISELNFQTLIPIGRAPWKWKCQIKQAKIAKNCILE